MMLSSLNSSLLLSTLSAPSTNSEYVTHINSFNPCKKPYDMHDEKTGANTGVEEHA